jgi:hypothetical protein
MISDKHHYNHYNTTYNQATDAQNKVLLDKIW